MIRKFLSFISIVIFIATTMIAIFPNIVEAVDNIEGSKFYYNQLTSDLSKSVYEGILNDTEATGKFRVDVNLSYSIEGINNENK